MCVPIFGCTAAFQNADESATCLACDPSLFQPLPLNNTCQCLQGRLINDMCVDLDGCVAPLLAPNGSLTCLFCDSSSGFQSSGGSCSCQDKYELKGSTCIEVCGDGYLVSAVYECDDGNLDDGDGCSSSCATEVGYRCENGSASSASACVYVGVPLEVDLQRIERTPGLDQGVFQFTIVPALFNINKMNLSH
jgi:cysteine-rich repeat protein